jgi:hypothetical protein
MEFELPAIFKTPAQPAAERPNLLGRLSEVLTHNGQQPDWDRQRTVIPFGPAHGRMIEPPPVVLDAVNDAQPPPSRKAKSEAEDVKRIMPTFFDTRMTRMSATTQPAPEPRREEAPAKPHVAEPPRLPRSHHELAPGDFHNDDVEDAAAQLLRPILKQWLTENMPKIVEKALRSETGEDESGGSTRY